jgi:hypothetical protein
MTATYTPDHAGIGRMLRADFMVAEMVRRAEGIRARAEAIAPTGSRAEGDEEPGRYRASFRIRSSDHGGATRDRAEAIVYNDAPSAFWVEFGHYGREPYRVLARAAFEVTP